MSWKCSLFFIETGFFNPLALIFLTLSIFITFFFRNSTRTVTGNSQGHQGKILLHVSKYRERIQQVRLWAGQIHQALRRNSLHQQETIQCWCWLWEVSWTWNFLPPRSKFPIAWCWIECIGIFVWVSKRCPRKIEKSICLILHQNLTLSFFSRHLFNCHMHPFTLDKYNTQ